MTYFNGRDEDGRVENPNTGMEALVHACKKITVDVVLSAVRPFNREIGDGKIFVTNHKECIRIRTDEDGGRTI